ncbi:PleD family two-component system response regulator [Elusimicrobiota bacterium]
MKPTILIADDDKFIVQFLQDNLEKHDFRIIYAHDGYSTISTMSSEKPDLVILDINMPQMNGLEILASIKENPATCNVPVIMITAEEDSEIFEKAVERKADAYIVKPFKMDHLLDRIHHILGNSD